MQWLPLDNFRSRASMLRFFIPASIGLVLDLWTKSLAASHLKGSRPVEFLPGWLNFEYVENLGAVFGMGQGGRWFFIVASAAAIVFLLYLFATSRCRPLMHVVIGLVMAGVLGNLYDRALYGHVRDMVHALPGWANPVPWLYRADEIFPWVFNLADSFLVIGVPSLVILLAKASKEEQAERTAESPGPNAKTHKRI